MATVGVKGLNVKQKHLNIRSSYEEHRAVD